jgi:hypothetical protein
MLPFRLCLSALLLLSVVGTASGPSGAASAPQHFVFVDRDRERLSDPTLLGNTAIAGVQVKYTWRELEPARNRYDLQPILDDMARLEQHGKRLFVQLQDVSFSSQVLVPDYLVSDPGFHGGVARKYAIQGDDEGTARFEGWVARRWDPSVRERFVALLNVLGKAVDGRIEGLNLAETSVDFGTSGKLHPAGFTYDSYLDGIKALMTGARQAFPRSPVILYANFMPGEWLPWNDHGYLKSVYAWANKTGVGVGGPDVLPHRRGQQNHSYPLIAARASGIPAGIAVQDDNLAEINPAAGTRVSAQELYEFARERLRVDYIFWGTQEPYYTKEVLPLLAQIRTGRTVGILQSQRPLP